MILYLCTVRDITELETVSSLPVHKSIYSCMLLRLEIDFILVYWEGLTELETVSSLPVHKSIYSCMLLRLEIDFILVYWEGAYGTGIGGTL